MTASWSRMAKDANDLVFGGATAAPGRSLSSPAVRSRRAARLFCTASIEKRAPIGRNKVQKQRRLMAQSPPFSVKISRSCRLTMQANERTCAARVCQPTVKTKNGSAQRTNITAASVGRDAAKKNENMYSELGR